jgi:hypothetical protein
MTLCIGEIANGLPSPQLVLAVTIVRLGQKQVRFFHELKPLVPDLAFRIAEHIAALQRRDTGAVEGIERCRNQLGLVVLGYRSQPAWCADWAWLYGDGNGDDLMPGRNMRLAISVLIFPARFSRHQLEGFPRHGEVLAAHGQGPPLTG